MELTDKQKFTLGIIADYISRTSIMFDDYVSTETDDEEEKITADEVSEWLRNL